MTNVGATSPGQRLSRESIRRSAYTVVACVMASLSGCAVFTPYQIFRFTADYNTERRMSFQAEVFDHLPPYPVRVRMNKWAYNVGPQPTSATIPIPAEAPVAPAPVPVQRPGAVMVPSVTPEPTSGESDLLDQSQPPPFPPTPTAPRTDLRSEQPPGRMGPSARANAPVRGASYTVPAVPSPTAPARNTPSPTGAWLFGS